MIVDPSAAEGEIIWRPDPSETERSGTERFAAFLRGRGIAVGE